MNRPTIQDVLNILEQSAADLSEFTFDLGRFERVESAHTRFDSGFGAVICVLGQHYSIQLAMLADTAGSRALADALLGEADSVPLSDEELQDAVNEFTNLLSGATKSSLVTYDKSVCIGTPHPIGHRDLSAFQNVVQSNVQLGDIQAQLAVLPTSSSLDASGRNPVHS